MGTKLLVRNYNVGCGDCTYIRLPGGDNGFHILIDCGSKESASSKVMERSLRDMEDQLPELADGKRRLDLLVVTHRHEDHIKGFDPDFFANIAIKNIWLSAAMDEKHPQATGTHALHRAAGSAMRGLIDSGAALSPVLSELADLYVDFDEDVAFGIGNKGAMAALITDLPRANGIDPTYVHAGMTSDDLGVAVPDGRIVVLGPEKDIDGFYLGKALSKNVQGLTDEIGQFPEAAQPTAASAPANISASDFEVLQSRLLSNALAFAVDDSSIQNNVSTVVLIEWRGRRLLFVGDGEWHNEYHEGRKNGTWNVMWNQRREHLDKPLDFLKAGHHGSKNATPYNPDAGPEHEVNQILDAILPLPADGVAATAECVVSTKRKQYKTIPSGELLVELGRRIKNTEQYEQRFKSEDAAFDPEADIFNYSVMKTYSGEPEPIEVGDRGTLDLPQPRRTDMESAGRGTKAMPSDVEYIDVEIGPAPGS